MSNATEFRRKKVIPIVAHLVKLKYIKEHEMRITRYEKSVKNEKAITGKTNHRCIESSSYSLERWRR